MSLATLPLSHSQLRAQQGKFAPHARRKPRQLRGTAEFNEGSSIGKRYRRQDEIGIPGESPSTTRRWTTTP
jgi:glycyl-tRNA synthetase (class II)